MAGTPRTRDVSLPPINWIWGTENYFEDQLQSTDDYSVAFQPVIRVMTDVVGNRLGVNRLRSHSISFVNDMTKDQYETEKVGGWQYKTYGCPPPVSALLVDALVLPNRESAFTRDLIINTPEYRKAVWAFYSKLYTPLARAGTSIGNFALEFGELRRLLDIFQGRWKSLTYDEALLAYQFGIKPLIGDLKSIAEALSKIENQISFLRRNFGRSIKVEHSESVQRGYQFIMGTEEDPDESSTGAYYRGYQDSMNGLIHITAKVGYDLTGFSDLQLYGGALAQYFGLTNPARILWNATRYSFLIDWVSSISRYLDLLEIPTGPRPIIYSACVTIRGERILRGHLWHYQNGGDEGPAGKEVLTIWERDPGLPERPLEIDFNFPTLIQAVLSAALGRQYLRGRVKTSLREKGPFNLWRAWKRYLAFGKL